MSERTARRNRRVEASRTETRLNVPATVPTTHPNAEIRRRADGSAYTWFPGFRGSDSRQADRLRERIQSKMEQPRGPLMFRDFKGYRHWLPALDVARQSMTEREKMLIERLSTFKPNREERKP